MSSYTRIRSMSGVALRIDGNKAESGWAAAEFVAKHISKALTTHDTARVIFATGASQYDFLSALIEQPDIDWTRVTAFHLDEYCNLPETHPASFRHYLRERLFKHLPFGAVHVLNGNADAEAECARYDRLLSEQPIDLACVGIGENGHLAFNDPPADFTTARHVHVVQLDQASRQQQVNEGHFATLADVPAEALSLTIPAILSARIVSCVVPEARKAEAVRRVLLEPISPDCPASALRTHANCTIFLDLESAALLPP